MSGAKFSPGRVVATPAALEALTASGESPLDFLQRHLAGDWGELDEHDIHENELSLQRGGRILSAYTLANGERIWVIPESDRSSTCMLLPSEY